MLKNKNKIPYIWWYIGISIFAFIIVFGIYLFKFAVFGLSDEQSSWSYLGDYLGGVLTPFLTIITIAILLKTLKVQSDEIASQGENLDQQRLLLYQNQFLMTFYKLIDSVVSTQQDDILESTSAGVTRQLKLINQNTTKKTLSTEVPTVYNRILNIILIIKLLNSNKSVIDYGFYSSYFYSQLNKTSNEILSKIENIEGISEDKIKAIRAFLDENK